MGYGVKYALYRAVQCTAHYKESVLREFRRGPVRKITLNNSEIFNTVLHTIWRTSHYTANCLLHGVLHTKYHTIHCTLQYTWRLDPNKNNSTLVFFCKQDMFSCHRSVQCVVY